MLSIATAMLSDNSEVAVAVISALSSIIVVILGGVITALSRNTNQKVNVIKKQVENSHVENPNMTSNLREDLDTKQDEVIKALNKIRSEQQIMRNEQLGMRDDHRVLSKNVVLIAERVGVLEEDSRQHSHDVL